MKLCASLWGWESLAKSTRAKTWQKIKKFVIRYQILRLYFSVDHNIHTAHKLRKVSLSWMYCLYHVGALSTVYLQYDTKYSVPGSRWLPVIYYLTLVLFWCFRDMQRWMMLRSARPPGEESIYEASSGVSIYYCILETVRLHSKWFCVAPGTRGDIEYPFVIACKWRILWWIL